MLVVGAVAGAGVVSWASASDSDSVSAADVARPNTLSRPNMESAFRREIASALVLPLMASSLP